MQQLIYYAGKYHTHFIKSLFITSYKRIKWIHTNTATVFGIINQYVRFLEVDETKDISDWNLDKDGELFIGKHRNRLKFTNRPEPYNIDSTANWLTLSRRFSNV